MERLVVRGLGVDVGFTVTGAGLVEAVRRGWGDATSPSSGSTSIDLTVAVGPEGDADVTGASIEEVMHNLSPTTTVHMIERRAGELVMLHAAALADPRSGATVVLVAPSGAGKTTAAAILGRSLAYLSDETAAIGPEGVVLPYRKPLSVIEDGHFKRQRSPSELRILTTERTCRIASILLLERSVRHTGEPRVALLETVDGLAALAPESSYLARLERPLHRLAALIDLAGGVRRVTYREADTLEPLITGLLGRHR